MPERTCSKCGETKPLTEFYKQAGCKDGRRPECKVCQKAQVVANRAKKADYYSAYDKQRYREQPGRAEANRESARKSYENRRDVAIEQRREYRQENRERLVEANRLYREEFPEKLAAHRAVARAVKQGELVPEPCLFCDDPNSQAHHHRYDRPLEVTWLCHRHHKLVHRIVEP